MSAERFDRLAEVVVVSAITIAEPQCREHVRTPADTAAVLLGEQGDRRLRRELTLGVETACLQLARCLEAFDAVGPRRMAEGGKDAAVDAVHAGVAELALTPAELVDLRMRGENVATRLRPRTVQRWRDAELDAQAQEYGQLFLHQAAEYTVSMATRLASALQNRAQRQPRAVADAVLECLRDSIDTFMVPRQRAEVSAEVSLFEARYLTDILQTHGYMELFGIDVPESFRRQPVDIGYISLLSSVPDRRTSGRDALMRVDAAVAEASKPMRDTRNRIPGLRPVSGDEDEGPEQVRILITGAPGSGKTTVTQWLAVRAARRDFPQTLEAFQGLVPFVVQLRHLFVGSRQAQPSVTDLARIGSHRVGNVPDDWIEAQLRGGNALLVFDGLDELVPLPHRRDAQTWIASLMARYPEAKFIVTSRPEALDTRWFSERSFRRLTLQPMRDADVRRCVRHWFSYLLKTSPSNAKRVYKGRRERLLGHIAERRSVSDLAETPLLCAMLCAFYASNLSDDVPKSRANLYGKVVKALLDARDRQRGVPGAGHRIEQTDKEYIVQAIARHMADNAVSSLRIQPLAVLDERYATTWSELQSFEANRGATVREILTHLMDTFASPRLGLDDALEYVVERSAVLQRVGPNEVQFAHRTFQEYLAACDYVDRGEAPRLVEYIRYDDAQWQRILVFAAAKSSRRDASVLVRDLVAEATAASSGRRRDLLLLIAECVSATSVEPGVARSVRTLLTEILPPRSREEARMLAGVGDHILNWLAGHTGDPATIEACVFAAGCIGGPEAMALIADYAAELGRAGRLPAWARELFCEMWDRFDAVEYAQRVLGEIDFGAETLRVDTAHKVPAVGALKHVRRLSVGIEKGTCEADPRTWAGLSAVEVLDCTGFRYLERLDGLEHLTTLRQLGLRVGPLVRDYGPLGRLSGLERLHLVNCRHLEDLGFLAGLPNLSVLCLEGCSRVTDWSPLRGLTGLRTLRISGGTMKDLDFCRPLTELRSLRAEPDDGLGDTSGVEDCRDLWRLHLRLGKAPRPPVVLPDPEAGWLRDVCLSGSVGAADLEAVARHERLLRLRVENPVDLDSLGPLTPLKRLETLEVVDARQLRDCAGLENWPELKSLDLSGSSIDNMDPAAGLTRLEKVGLARCPFLTDLTALLSLPVLRHVDLEENVGWLPLDVIEALRDVKRVRVEFDSYLNVGHAGA
ncbi:NACHT domain-containing protein [Wenjunlia tyrosinilytica]|uniref:ATP-binding protein n=1 Tax=Wenjunlia tyrosinilytica TaxID=1544741 RepID=A0A917ZHV7_9ACTN|nr:NACHT domain-containing protein [Wenjunlia tyrosinilytica]GGO82951.1 ATP-binding protein [Wenjunlia tyrosinilytica]